MYLHPKTSHAVGIEIAGDDVRLALVGPDGSCVKLETIPFDSVEFSSTFSQLKKGAQEPVSVASVSGKHCLIKNLELKLGTVEDIDAVLPFQMEPLLPYPVDDAILDRWILQMDPQKSKLSVLAVRGQDLDNSLEKLKKIGCEIEVMSCTAAAIAAFSFSLSPELTYCLHVELGCCTAAFVENGNVLGSRSFEFHDDDDLFKQSSRAQFALSRQVKRDPPEKTLLIGGDVQSYTAGFGEGYVVPENFKHAIAIGLAMAHVLPQLPVINLRKGAYAYPNPWKRLKPKLYAYLALTLSLSLAIWLLGVVWTNGKSHEITREYGELLQAVQKSHDELEAELYEIEGGERIPFDDLNLSDIESRIDFIQRQMEAAPSSFPLYPNIPKVADVLVWLSQHPSLSEEASALIRIESLTYSMVKRPDKKRPKEHYLVRIEIEFSTESPKHARAFHKALQEGDKFVNPKREITWGTSRGKYKTSFYLKDRTMYTS